MKATDTTETQYEDVKPSDWGKTALYVALGMVVIVLGATLLFNLHELRTVAVLIFGCIVLAVLATLVTWHTRTFAYRCTKCGEEFSISPVRDFLSPQGVGTKGGWKYLRCPRCNTRERAEVIKKVKKEV